MGNDPILSLSQSEVLNLYTMVTINNWSVWQDLNLRFLTSKASRLNQTFSHTDKLGGCCSNRTNLHARSMSWTSNLCPLVPTTTSKLGGPLGNRTPITDLQGQCNPIILAAHKKLVPSVGYDPTTAALSRRYLTIRSTGQ